MKTSTLPNQFSFSEWQTRQYNLRIKEKRTLFTGSFLISTLLFSSVLILAYHASSSPHPTLSLKGQAITFDLSSFSETHPSSPASNQQPLAATEPLPSIQKLPEFPVLNSSLALPKIQKISKIKTPLPIQHSQSQSNSLSAASKANTEFNPSSSKAKDTGQPSGHSSLTPKSWQNMVLSQFERVKHYPAEAQSEAQEGTAILHITINRQGNILTSKLLKNSGYSLLDQEVLALPQRIKTLPPLPDTIKGSVISLDIPIEFYLNNAS